ncbi:MAG: EAL domain-containing protein [Acidimicrobiaceae bacterium]|nr:EAL domain-containing protein [Acidimicrobiaceae bacterium]
MVDEAPRVLEIDQYFLVYQPEFDLHSNAFVGVEALIRWRDPSRGVVSPDEFLPSLEESGEIVPVGRWALQTACFQGAEWHDKGYRFSVSVNVSARQFDRIEFLEEVEQSLEASRFSPTHLVLEFSQSALDSPLGEERFEVLRSLGVRIAIDDIELDRADISVLVRSPIDIVKLDRRFIATVTDSTAAELVHSLVRQAKEHSIQVVASGIEDESQRDLLKLENVGIGQGFHFSAPREAPEIDQLLLDFSIFSGKPI